MLARMIKTAAVNIPLSELNKGVQLHLIVVRTSVNSNGSSGCAWGPLQVGYVIQGLH